MNRNKILEIINAMSDSALADMFRNYLGLSETPTPVRVSRAPVAKRTAPKPAHSFTAKKVYSKDGTVYPSMAQASRETGIERTYLYKTINAKGSITCKGHTLSYTPFSKTKAREPQIDIPARGSTRRVNGNALVKI